MNFVLTHLSLHNRAILAQTFVMCAVSRMNRSCRSGMNGRFVKQ